MLNGNVILIERNHKMKRTKISKLPGIRYGGEVGREVEGIPCPKCNGYADLALN